jgi:type I restriction enzyme S subunit
MAVYNIINLHEIQNRIRIEAEFYKPEYVDNYKTIEKLPHLKLKNNSLKISDGTHFTPQYIKSGVKFYSAINVKEAFFVYDESYKFISEAEHRSIHARCPVRSGDVLLRKVGVGPRWSCVVPEGIAEFSIFVSVALVRPNSRLFPEYLSTFINCKYGQLQLLRLNKGISQPDLHLEDIGELIIPEFTPEIQLEISTIIKSAQVKLEESKYQYTQAQQILESELGLDKLNFQKPMGYTANISEAVTGRRFDADYFQPQYFTIQQLIKRYSNGFESLIDCVTPLKPNIDPSNTPSQLYNYIELSNINASLGTVDGFETKFGKALPSRARRKVQYGDVIASAVVGSIDKAAIVDHAQDGFIASTGFFHLRPRTISSEYLLLLVRSKCVRMQFQQQSTGGILSAVPDSRLKRVIIPKLPESLQSEISELVKRSHSAKRQSQDFFEKAKTRVEQLIEEAVQS